METIVLTYHQLELEFARWASSQPDVRAMVVFGSRARTEHSASEWSDLDLIIILNQPAEWTANPDWLASIGEVQFTAREAFTRSDWIPLVVIFNGMRKVDIVFTIIPANYSPIDDLSLILAASPYPHVFSNGAKDEFTNDVNLFWLHAIHTAILIQCGERWRACNELLVELKGRLLIFLEWQARLHYGVEHKIWPRGCYLEDWADTRAVAALPDYFIGGLSGDLWGTLLATFDVFHWLAVEIANGLGYIYSTASESCSRDYFKYAHSSHLL